MTETPFDHLEEMKTLEKIISRKEKLSFGDEHVTRYWTLRTKILSYQPRTEEEFLSFMTETHQGYTKKMEEEVEAVRSRLHTQLEKANERLTKIADSIEPYLTTDES